MNNTYWFAVCSVVCFALLSGLAQQPVVRDITAENVFTRNCEGPAVDGRGRLFVVNYARDGTIGLVQTEGLKELKKVAVECYVVLPQGSIGNSVRIGKHGEMYIADFKAHNIFVLDTCRREIREYLHSERFHQPNDLCITSRGVLFVSDPHWKDSTGKLWRIDPDSSGNNGTLILLDSVLGTTNGIACSPDEKTLYVNESVQRNIWAYTLDAQGNISNKRLFASFRDYGLDGMKCDNAGNLYVARYGKGVIAVLSPQGKLLREIALKGKDCSNLTFGGKDRKTVYVTMQDRKCVEAFRVSIPGNQ
ncbi:MAG: SMP-30/gluconolactonase/LRE family protein [Bacteroidota bacterium]|nr:SMP-30/gluconolactonase/LRE family protein [Candidatus Kapabacteria bacterium]MDW8219954.1 SMP-30/gluconolactonase/LRE family protein [Bacteroidota bacterium]